MAKTLFGEDRFVGFDSWEISLWADEGLGDETGRQVNTIQQALVFSRPLSQEPSDGIGAGTMTHSPSLSKKNSDAIGEGSAKRGISTREAR
ncbi:hypothetical protein B0H65DRAFT_509099 [Neurospora tetraspora]|uniref:Uncharacterized protein n=1 Tax=Neurospora tetraspora TaxID=94610 RepID=A0AAE0JFY0_9PEZI|nr:hypothetical protein B0H65DRAFT_509099 [Neurospora tetraspora]